ncbi:hypothetical protein L1887_24999 [Cichorium endivia]|nr:hypothetical protein L1887_24999 [Cichorium endivia]
MPCLVKTKFYYYTVHVFLCGNLMAPFFMILFFNWFWFLDLFLILLAMVTSPREGGEHFSRMSPNAKNLPCHSMDYTPYMPDFGE